MGTPQILSDDNQAIVWQADYMPFGEATLTKEYITFNLRFPGQYFDAETGMHYNYFRDYDPTTGRYLESDPIGLDGGLNTYLYANANPLRYTDPTGENPASGAIWGGNIGTGIGALGGPVGAGIGRVVGSAIGAGIAYGIAKMCGEDEDDREERCDKQYYDVDIPTCRGISRSRGPAARNAVMLQQRKDTPHVWQVDQCRRLTLTIIDYVLPT